MIFLLKKFRIKAGISEGELAFRSGLAQSYISYLENHIKHPSPNVVEHLASVLNICPYDLLDFCSSCKIMSSCDRKNVPSMTS